MPNVEDIRDGSFDRCKLGGVQLPGRVWCNVKVSSDLDIKKADGKSGATMRDRGDPPKEVTITIRVHTDDLLEMTQLEAARDVLLPKRTNGARDPQKIEHPNAALWKIDAVTVETIDSPQPDPEGYWEITAKCLEWLPEPAKTRKSKKAPKDKPEDVEAWREFSDDWIPPDDTDGVISDQEIVDAFYPTQQPSSDVFNYE